MAGQRNVMKAMALMVAVVAMFSAVSAQELGAPAPAPDHGAAYSLPMSGAIVCSSLVLSLLALVKH